MQVTVTQEEINQVLRDNDMSDEHITKIWDLIGLPYKGGEVSLSFVIQNLATVALSQYHPLGAKMTQEQFLTFMDRQGFSSREKVEVLERMGWPMLNLGTKTIAGIFTRLFKAIARPGVKQ